jgi:CIC family chloride channel protein
MLTATIAYATMKFFIPNSVYTYQLAKRGHLLTHHKDRAVLSMMRVAKLIERNFTTIGPDQSLGDLIKVFSESNRNLFPVVDKENKFLGLIRLDDIRQIMFQPELYEETKISSLMIVPVVTIDPDESMEDVAKKFQDSGKFNIAVIKDGYYLGFVSRAKVFSKYRSLTKYFSDD